jgi:hypothetical protein
MTTARERAEELTKGWQGYTEYLAPTGLGTQNLVYRSITGFRDDIEAAILAAEQAAEARGRAAGIEMAAEFGWVIERDESEGSRLEYFTGAIQPVSKTPSICLMRSMGRGRIVLSNMVGMSSRHQQRGRTDNHARYLRSVHALRDNRRRSRHWLCAGKLRRQDRRNH